MDVILTVLVAIIAAFVTFWVGQYLGVVQPILGLIAFAVFLAIVFYGRGWFKRPL
jgi:hypothetical protein